jgi:hypothetical protein
LMSSSEQAVFDTGHRHPLPIRLDPDAPIACPLARCLLRCLLRTGG